MYLNDYFKAVLFFVSLTRISMRLGNHKAERCLLCVLFVYVFIYFHTSHILYSLLRVD